MTILRAEAAQPTSLDVMADLALFGPKFPG